MTVTSRTGKPIIIADYDPAWPRIFQQERAMILRRCSPGAFVRIEHMGSTAVPGLAAKPIVDIMPGVRTLDAFATEIRALESLGYRYVPEFERDGPLGPGMPFRRYFRKDVDGVRAFHLHVVRTDSDFWRDHLMFRNYLRTEPPQAQRYADLKRRLADEYNRTMLADGVDVNIGYTNYKDEFIAEIMARARARAARSTPVAIVPYNELWPVRFAKLRDEIAPAVGKLAVDMQHVGSTSVPGLAAKPTIDLAIGVRTMDDGRAMKGALFALGYAKGEENFPDWLYFDREQRGTMDNVHVHIHPFGGERWTQKLLLRDYLRERPEEAAAYERLKRALAAEWGRDRLGYVEGKTEFVQDIVRRATAVALR